MSAGFDKKAGSGGNVDPDLYILNQNAVVEPKSFRIANLGEVGTLLATGNGTVNGNFTASTTSGTKTVIGVTTGIANYKLEVVSGMTNLNGLYVKGGSNLVGNNALRVDNTTTELFAVRNNGIVNITTGSLRINSSNTNQRLLINNNPGVLNNFIKTDSAIEISAAYTANTLGAISIIYPSGGNTADYLRFYASAGTAEVFRLQKSGSSTLMYGLAGNVNIQFLNSNTILNPSTGNVLVGTTTDNDYRLQAVGNATTVNGLLVQGGSSTTGNAALFRNLALTSLFQVLNANRTLVGGAVDNTIDRLQVNGSTCYDYAISLTTAPTTATVTATNEEVVILNNAATTSVVFPTGRDGRKFIVHNRTGNNLTTTSYLNANNAATTTQLNHSIHTYRYFGATWYLESATQ